MSDYADKIALDILDDNGIDEWNPIDPAALPEMLAAAAREGYALGYGTHQ